MRSFTSPSEPGKKEILSPLGTSRRVLPLASLTSWRFFAAASIVAFHTIATTGYTYLRCGVWFFYVLSGFILVYVHPRVAGRAETARFWLARWARIWPLHVATFLIAFFGPFNLVPLQKYLLTGLFLNLALLQSWIPLARVVFSVNGVSWSLSVEAFFYTIFPFLLPYVARAPGKMVLLAVLLKVFLCLFGIFIGLPQYTTGHSASYETFAIFNPAMHLYEFVFGMALAVWWRNRISRSESFAFWTRWEVSACLSVVVLIPVFAHLITVFLPMREYYSFGDQLQEFLCVPSFGLLIYVFACQGGWISRLLSHPWLVYLGEISFSIYMVQGFVIWPFIKYFPANHPLAEGLAFILAILAVSALSYTIVEKPSRKFLTRVGNRAIDRWQPAHPR